MPSAKNIEEKKLALIQWLSTIEDQTVIDKMMELKKLEQSDWCEDISEEEKASIQKGIADADADKLSPHQEVRKRYEKWL